MIGRILIVNAVLLAVYMSLSLLVARSKKRLDIVDTAWGLGFVVVVWSVVVQQSSARSWLVAVLVSIWGVRLALHIGRRSLQRGGEDPRYEELSREWRGNTWLQAYFRVFLLQGALVWIISLPVVMATGSPNAGLGWLGIAGTAIWLAGFVFEAVADHQLAKFLLAKNRPKVLQTGLWRYSRHPNYFGELTQWWAIGLIALQTNYGWIGLVGPLVLTYLIVFVSGIPPIERRRQKDVEYQAYQRQTSPLIPLPPRRVS
jgi:steroid 5-alpha reductase family enzyme